MERFEELVKQYERMIWNIIHSLRIYKNKDEFFQIGMIALWEARRRFDPAKGSFSGFAYSYIKGRMLSELTKENGHEQRSVYPKETFWGVIEDDNPSRPLEEEFVLSFFHNLTENQKKWVLYTTIDFLSTKEIAEKEGVSISAVKAWRKGAKEKLIGSLEIRE